MMRKIWRKNPDRRRALSRRTSQRMASPKARAAKSSLMGRLNSRRGIDGPYRAKWLRAIRGARRRKSYRSMQSLVMKDLWTRSPERKRKGRELMQRINRKRAKR